MKPLHQCTAAFLCGCLVVASTHTVFADSPATPVSQPAPEVEQQAPQVVQPAPQAVQPTPQVEQSAPQAVQQTPEQLRQLVAPIALYPDPLVGQILAAATYPAEVMAAEEWMQQHQALTGDALAKEVDKQSWDPSVKGLTQFPSVLANMSQNLAWTSELGDAYVNQGQELTQTIQSMRHLAKNAGNLYSTSQENVTTEGDTIDVEPASTDEVYVPQYDPWLVYGDSLPVFPGWAPYPGLYLYGPGIGFELGFGIGWLGGYPWGWNNWGCDWHRGAVLYNHHAFTSHSRNIVNRDSARSVDHGFHSTRFAGHTVAHTSHSFHSATAKRLSSVSRSHSGAHAFFHSGGSHGFHGGGFHGGGFHGGGSHGGHGGKR